MKKEIAAMVVKSLKSGGKKEKIVSYEKEKDDEDLYNLVRGERSAMMVQRKEHEEDYVPRRKVIMMISSESDGEYTPKRPSEKDKKDKDIKKSDTKETNEPIKNNQIKKNVSGSESSSAPLPHVTKQDKEDGTSLFMTSSSESATSSDSSSDSSSSEEEGNESPEKKRVKKSRKKGQKKAKKRASRNELTASFAHEREQVGLALQQQHHLLSNVSERLISHSGTLDQLTQELVAVRARAEEARKKREEEFRQREIERQRMLEDSRRREEGYKRMINESELRASARANEKKEMLSGLNNYADIQRARLDVLRKDKRQDRCERMKRKRADQNKRKTLEKQNLLGNPFRIKVPV